MKIEDKKAFFTLVAMTAEAYDVTNISKGRLALMFDDLQDYSIEQIAAAFREHRQACKWFPKVSELIERMTPNTEQVAMVSWAEVLPLLRDSRNAKSPDPVTERVIQDLGGWVRLGQQTSDQLVWTAKEFAQRYAMYAEHGSDMPRIAGPRKGLMLVGRDE
jgi:hypothetical protein